MVRFYEILAELERRVGGKRFLAKCDGRMGWPRQGVYFFFEPGEMRSDSGDGSRVVRVGTHGLTATSKSTLWNRLSQHRGTKDSGGGNHRGSMFRLLVGAAILERDQLSDTKCWGLKRDAGAAGRKYGFTGKHVRDMERPIEAAVTKHIGAMPFLWVAVEDEPGGRRHRATIERNSIALLSNWERPVLDRKSASWLGSYCCGHELVRASGLWNNHHVDEAYDPRFLDILQDYVMHARRLANG